MKRYRMVMVLTVIAALVLAACGSQPAMVENSQGAENPPPANEGPIKIGSLMPLTGDLSFIGADMAAAIELAVQEANDAGGVLGRQVEVVGKDSETNETATRDAMDQLVSLEKVPVVIGAAGSGNSRVALEVATPANVVLISPSSTAPDFTTNDKGGFFFRTAPSDTLQGKVMAKLALQRGYKTAATLALNNDYGVGFKDVFIKAFETGGGEMVADVLYDQQATAFDGEITQLLNADPAPDVIILVGYYETGSTILQTAYQLGLLEKTDFLLSEGLFAEDFANLVGKDDNGNYIIAGVQGTRPKSQGPGYSDFISAFEKTNGHKPGGPYDAHSFDAAALALLAMQKAGEASGPAIKDALVSVASPPGKKVSSLAEALQALANGEDIDYEGASGNVNLDDVGDVQSAYEVWEVQSDGTIKVISELTPD